LTIQFLPGGPPLTLSRASGIRRAGGVTRFVLSNPLQSSGYDAQGNAVAISTDVWNLQLELVRAGANGSFKASAATSIKGRIQ
jgi:hypothetical protein